MLLNGHKSIASKSVMSANVRRMQRSRQAGGDAKPLSFGSLLVTKVYVTYGMEVGWLEACQSS